MDAGLRLYKIRYRFGPEQTNDRKLVPPEALVRIFFARSEDEAWRKFYAYAKNRINNPHAVQVKELSEEEMKQIEVLVPFYKEYTL